MISPEIGQHIKFRKKGGNAWTQGRVSCKWQYDGEDIFDLEEGGSFIPSLGDEWEVVR
jgi:hypothetical protein